MSVKSVVLTVYRDGDPQTFVVNEGQEIHLEEIPKTSLSVKVIKLQVDKTKIIVVGPDDD